METFIGFLAGIGVSALAAAVIYLLIRAKKIEEKFENYVKVKDFNAFTNSVEKVSHAEEILAELKMYGKHVEDLHKVVIDNNKTVISKFKEHESVLNSQNDIISTIATNLKKLSDYVVNMNK